jgi:hypothetical protein
MDFLKGISSSMKKAQDNMASEDFLLVAGLLSDTKDTARNQAQQVTAEKVKEVIQRLKKNEALTPEDIDCARLWIVGDAESYPGLENSFKEWCAEFKRLESAVREYENKELALADLFKMHGMLEDAQRIATDIGSFLEKKERIAHFERIIKDVENLDREILINILETKLKSPRI